MKQSLFLIVFFVSISAMIAQIENNTNTVQFEVEDKNNQDPTGLELPAKPKPGLTLPKDKRNPTANMSLGGPEEKTFSMSTDDGLLDNSKGKTPKAFAKDKEPLPKYAKDQFLGDVKTGATFVSIKYRDHEYVDGDLIRVYVNEDVVQARAYLTSSFSGFTLNLEPGTHRIEFEALNQGSSGPNTAELHVYDDKGMIISAKEWNLLTGRRASIIVIKE